MRRALSDLTVVELAEGVAGSYCGKLFADLGADVIKVERPDGDPLRAPERRGWRRSPADGAFFHLNTNKRSVVIDTGRPGGADRLWRLLERADLVIDAPGAGSPGGLRRDLG